MDDLVERLRAFTVLMHSKDGHPLGYAAPAIQTEAADRIQALEARIAELQPANARWSIGAKVRKKRGSSWRGAVVGRIITVFQIPKTRRSPLFIEHVARPPDSPICWHLAHFPASPRARAMAARASFARSILAARSRRIFERASVMAV